VWKRAEGIKDVLRSLTPAHHQVLKILAEYMFQNEKTNESDANSNGLTYREWYSACEQKLIVSNETAFRAMLTELIDHELVIKQKIVDKNSKLKIKKKIVIESEIYVIPYENEIIKKEILK